MNRDADTNMASQSPSRHTIDQSLSSSISQKLAQDIADARSAHIRNGINLEILSPVTYFQKMRKGSAPFELPALDANVPAPSLTAAQFNAIYGATLFRCKTEMHRDAHRALMNESSDRDAKEQAAAAAYDRGDEDEGEEGNAPMMPLDSPAPRDSSNRRSRSPRSRSPRSRSP